MLCVGLMKQRLTNKLTISEQVKAIYNSSHESETTDRLAPRCWLIVGSNSLACPDSRLNE